MTKRSLSPLDSSFRRSEPISHLYGCVPSAWFCTGTYCVHHKLVALESRPIRNKTSCCCQVREGKCTCVQRIIDLSSFPGPSWIWYTMPWTAPMMITMPSSCSASYTPCLITKVGMLLTIFGVWHSALLFTGTGEEGGGRALGEGVSFLASEVTTTVLFFSHITISQVFFCRLKPQALVTQAWWWEIQVWLSKPVRLASHCGFLQTPLCFTTNLTNDHFDIRAKPVKLEPWFCYL